MRNPASRVAPGEVLRGQVKNKTVISEVSAGNLCIGCGICSAICPKKRLSLRLGDRGIHAVQEDATECAENCERCLRVCPFSDRVPDENEIANKLYGSLPGIGHHDLAGYYQSAQTGYVRRGNIRARGSSGGMATWALASLLEQKAVDRVVCVSGGGRSHPFFDFRVCGTVDEVRASSKSIYYPVEMSGVLAEIMSTPGRCAVIGLPCFCKALRLLMQQSRKAAEKIVFLAGLKCSHGASTYFSEYLAEKAGGDAGRLRQVDFRIKHPGRRANDFGTECVWENAEGGLQRKTLYWQGDLIHAWLGHWFSPVPCLFCDDIVAETADITFMDAWRPEFALDTEGTSCVILRSDLAAELCRQGMSSKEVFLEPMAISDVSGMQKRLAVGKRRGVSYRLWLRQRRGAAVPKKRVAPRRTGDLLQRVRWKNQMNAAETGPRRWVNRKSVHDFEAKMRRMEAGQRLLRKAGKLMKRL